MPTSSVWFVYLEGDLFGPVSAQGIEILVRRGRLHFSDYVWSEGMSSWARLGELGHFGAYFPTAPPVPVPGKGAVASRLSIKPQAMAANRVSIEALAQIDGFGEFPVSDISQGGMFFRADKTIPFGTDLRFRLEWGLLPHPVVMTGVVVREGTAANGDTGFAVRFTRMTPGWETAEEALRAALASR